MAHYLVYWQTFKQDHENPYAHVTPAWYTNEKGFHEKVRKDDNIWVVVSGGEKTPDEWCLIQRFVVAKVNSEPEKSKTGYYKIIGLKKGNQVFDIQQQPDFTAILWMLEFSTGKRIKYLGQKIGQSLQTHGHRTLTENDVLLLEKYAKQLIRI